MLGVQIDHAHARLLKDPQLRGKIVIKIRVLDRRDVVGAYVQKAANCQVKPLNAAVFQPLARDLHNHVIKTGCARVGQMPPQIGSFRRGVVALVALNTIKGFNGTYQATGLATCGNAPVAAARLKDGAQHVRYRGLPLGARYAHNGELPIRMSPGLSGNQRHGSPHIIRQKRRHTRGNFSQLRGPFHRREVGSCPRCHGRRQIRRLKRRALADEYVSRRHHARIAARARHRRVRRSVQQAGHTGEQALTPKQLHDM